MEKQNVLTERSITVEVLKKYKSLTYLWNPTHKLYTNKIARRQGLEIMLQSWRKLEPNATLQCMRRKLNNWRAAYRRERNKVENSLVSASEPDEYHKPCLWYYNYLTFIHDDCPVLSKDDDDGGVENIVEINVPCESEVEAASETDERIEEDVDSDNNDHEEDEDVVDDVFEDVVEEVEPGRKKPRKSSKRQNKDIISRKYEIADSAQVSQSNDESSADLFGRAIGSQLKEVSKFQRCLAEKLISEIMFYAKLEQLTFGTSVNLESSDS